jgi:NDP-sugar pyrophosphorylase family protein
VHTVDVRAILLVGGLGDSAADENENFAGTPLALHDVLGKPVVARVIERLKAQSVHAISVISESPLAGSAKLPVAWTETSAAQFWRVAEGVFSDLAQAGAEAVLVIRMGGYAEFDVDDFLQRHLDGRAHVTRAVDANGSPLDMFVICASRRNDAAYLFRHRLQQTRSACGHWVFCGYYNPLASARELRTLAVDGLLARARLKPAGVERRPGVWVARGATIDRRARVLAPAFIGEHAKVRASAVVTRCGVVERHAQVDSGTVIEDATVLPYTYIGPGLDVAHAVAAGHRLLHVPRNVEIEIADPKLMDARSQHAPLRALESAASLATFLPVQFLRGLFAKSRREQPAELPDAVKTPSAINTPTGFEASPEASSFPANLAVARRYGDQ